MLSPVLAFLFGVLSELINGLKLVFCPEAWGSLTPVVIAFAGIAVWLGSGFLGATVAELSGHPATRHFFMSLLLPYFYPVYLMGHIKRREASVAAVAETMKEHARNAASGRFNMARAERLAVRKGISVEAAAAELEAQEKTADDASSGIQSEAVSAYSMESFDSLPVDASGLRHGPFVVVARDGRSFNVDYIKSVQNDLLIMVCAGKTVRIKFTEMESFDKV